MEHCRAAIRTGSLSFHAASRLLPARVRDPALALYAFCRLADDAVDDSDDKAPAVLGILLDLIDRLCFYSALNILTLYVEIVQLTGELLGFTGVIRS